MKKLQKYNYITVHGYWRESNPGFNLKFSLKVTNPLPEHASRGLCYNWINCKMHGYI